MGLLDLAVGAVVPWYIRWPLSALGGIKAGLVWLWASPLRMALLVIMVLGLLLVRQGHARTADRARAEAEHARLLKAFVMERAAFSMLSGVLITQNAAIRDWQLVGKIRHQMAMRDLHFIEEKSKPLIAAANQLDQDARDTNAPPAADCKTPAAVMVKRGDL